MKRLYFTVLLFAFVIQGSAQDAELDSLLKVLKTAPDDTSKLKLLENIADIAPDGEWQKYNQEIGKLAVKCLASSDSATNLIGKRFYTVNLINRAYELAEKGDLKSALDLYGRCVKIDKEIKDNYDLGIVLLSIGAIYDRQDDANNAINNYEQALEIQKFTYNNKDMIATLVNLGALYAKKNMIDSSLAFNLQALKITEQHNYQFTNVVNLYANLGENMELKGNFLKATEYYTKGLRIADTIGYVAGRAINFKGLASVYLHIGNSFEALTNAKRALSLATTSQNLRTIGKVAELLKRIYQKQANFKDAFAMYNLEISMRDSIARKENEKAVLRHQFQYDYDLKEATAKAEQEKKDGIANAELKRQKTQKLAFLSGFGIMVLFAGVFFRQRNKIGREKKRSEDLLLNILPEEVAEELKAKGEAEAKLIDEVTVLFTDFKGFTTMSEKLTPKELVRDIHECFSAFDHIMEKYGMEKIKTIGDSYMAAGGLPTANKTHATDAVNAAIEIRQFIEEGKVYKIANGQPYFEIRIGIHTGSVVAGIVGVKKFAYDIWGDTVNTASRMESSGEVGQINISGSTYELVKDKFKCTHRGKISAKGKGDIDMYFVEEQV